MCVIRTLRLLLCLPLAVALFAPAARAEGPVARGKHVRVSLLAEDAEVVPGRGTTLWILFEPEPGWHVYWRNPRDAGQAPRVSWTLPEGATAVPLRWPAPRRLVEGPLVTYVYHMDQAGRWGDQFYPSGMVTPSREHPFGEDFVPRPDFIPEQGRWVCYELMVKGNEPGLRDGRIAFWVDGELKGDFPNLRLRNVESLKANRINLGVYTHNPRTKTDITMWYDDVVVATSYIGPQTER